MGAWTRAAVVGILFLVASVGCSGNILTSFSDTTTNAALYDAALIDMNAKNYTAALNAVAAMTSGYQTSPQVIALKASAYAGLGGLNFISFVQSYQSNSALLFPFLLQSFDNASASAMTYSLDAQNTLTAISQPNTDQSIFLALVSLENIGNILSYYADPTQTGTGTTGWDPCAVGSSRTAGGSMTDSDAREVAVALSLAISNLTAVAGSLNLGSSTLTSLNSLCADLQTYGAAYDFCGVTDPSSLTADQVKGARSLVKESQDIGLGTNCTGSLTTCNCFP